jgi:hypothetical protein
MDNSARAGDLKRSLCMNQVAKVTSVARPGFSRRMASSGPAQVWMLNAWDSGEEVEF